MCLRQGQISREEEADSFCLRNLLFNHCRPYYSVHASLFEVPGFSILSQRFALRFWITLNWPWKLVTIKTNYYYNICRYSLHSFLHSESSILGNLQRNKMATQLPTLELLKDLNQVRSIRFIHTNEATLYFLCTYTCIFNHSYKLFKVRIVGVIIYKLFTSTAFLGYYREKTPRSSTIFSFFLN